MGIGITNMVEQETQASVPPNKEQQLAIYKQAQLRESSGVQLSVNNTMDKIT